MSPTRRAAFAFAAVTSSILWGSVASADEPTFHVDAEAGFLRLTRFQNEPALPTALVYGVSGAALFGRVVGAGVSVRLSQPDSYRVPCEADRFCLRRFQQFGLFGETRWRRPELAVAWEPWLRAGTDAIQAASEPPTAEGDPGVQWAVGLDARVGSDLRLRWLLLGVYGEAVVATGDIRWGYGMGLRAGFVFDPEPRHEPAVAEP